MTTRELSYLPTTVIYYKHFIALIVVLYASAIVYTNHFYPSQIFVGKKRFNSAIIYLQNVNTRTLQLT